MLMKGLRRNGDAMKNQSWYLKIKKVLDFFKLYTS